MTEVTRIGEMAWGSAMTAGNGTEIGVTVVTEAVSGRGAGPRIGAEIVIGRGVAAGRDAVTRSGPPQEEQWNRIRETYICTN